MTNNLPRAIEPSATRSAAKAAMVRRSPVEAMLVGGGVAEVPESRGLNAEHALTDLAGGHDVVFHAAIMAGQGTGRKIGFSLRVRLVRDRMRLAMTTRTTDECGK